MATSRISQYLAITIGPILKTLMEARRTRELWAGSFLLSTLMKHLILELDPKNDRVLIPKIPMTVSTATLFGAGIYPDRLFMKADEMTISDVETAIEKALKGLAKETLLATESQKKERLKKAVDFWRRFFRIRYVLKPMDDISNGKLSLELTPYLETLETEDTCFQEEPAHNELLELFDENRIYQVPLSNGLKGNNRGIYDAILTSFSFFPSTLELSAFELFSKENGLLFGISEKVRKSRNEGSEEFFRLIEGNAQLKKHFLPRHKYFCIVQADGDNIGKAIQGLNSETDYSGFSEKLASFGKVAAERINTYGGKPVYIGGDDLLFLAPVHNGKESVLQLTCDLDRAFQEQNLHPDTSLSFGVNVVYYKYPLFEAIGDAYNILHTAKSHKNQLGKKKNAISFRLTKHSGTFFSAVFSKDFLNAAMEAIEAFQESAPKGKKGIVSSLIFKIRTLEKLLDNVFSQEADKVKQDAGYTPDLEGRLSAFFRAFFNEWKDEKGFEQQNQAVQKLLIAAYQEAGAKQWLSLFYAMMRFIDFMFAPNEIQTPTHDTENLVASAG